MKVLKGLKNIFISLLLPLLLFSISGCRSYEKEQSHYGILKIRWGMEIEETENYASVPLNWNRRDPDKLVGERELSGIKFEATYGFTIGKLTSVHYHRTGSTTEKYKTAFINLQKLLDETYGAPTDQSELLNYSWKRESLIVHHRLKSGPNSYYHYIDFYSPEHYKEPTELTENAKSSWSSSIGK